MTCKSADYRFSNGGQDDFITDHRLSNGGLQGWLWHGLCGHDMLLQYSPPTFIIPSLTFSLHHTTLRTRPSWFSAFNIGMGLGTRLSEVNVHVPTTTMYKPQFFLFPISLDKQPAKVCTARVDFARSMQTAVFAWRGLTWMASDSRWVICISVM